MAYFAKVRNGVVQDVIKCEQSHIDNLLDTSPGKWIETWKDGGPRKNFASIGHIYDKVRDMFYRRQPFPSWILNEETGRWDAPIEIPSTSGFYEWNEETQTWDEVDGI